MLINENVMVYWTTTKAKSRNLNNVKLQKTKTIKIDHCSDVHLNQKH